MAIWIGYFGDQHKITPWEQIFMVMRVKTQKSDFNGRLLFTVLASIFNFSLEIIETCVWEKLGGILLKFTWSQRPQDLTMVIIADHIWDWPL